MYQFRVKNGRFIKLSIVVALLGFAVFSQFFRPDVGTQVYYVDPVGTEYSSDIVKVYGPDSPPVSLKAMAGEPLVDLDASRLQPGILTEWDNAGSLGGEFSRFNKYGKSSTPTVENVGGKLAVVFQGGGTDLDDMMESSFDAPASLGGSNPFSIAVWAYNPMIDVLENIVSWSDRASEGDYGALGWGTSTTEGAAYTREGTDLAYDGVPAAKEWHHVVVTFDGSNSTGTLKLYVDGSLNDSASITNEMGGQSGEPIIIGGMYWTGQYSPDRLYNPFSGALASVKIYDSELSSADVEDLFEEEPPSTWTTTRNDITFFVLTDTHYGNGNEADVQTIIDKMNVIPGTAYPEDIGGNVDTPRGVLIAGDVTHNGEQHEWDSFTADFGVAGEGRCRYPVYEGFGNHDDPANSPVLAGIMARNHDRPMVTNTSANELHYSWDWDDVHFVCLNVFPGNTQTVPGDDADPFFALDFLTSDLSDHVGSSGRPVVIFHHFGYNNDGKNKWVPAWRVTLEDLLEHYNVVGMFSGHTHGVEYTNWEGMDTYITGPAQPLSDDYGFAAVHLTTTGMSIALRSQNDTWETVWEKDCDFPSEPGVIEKGPYLIYPADITKMDVLWQLDGTYTCRIDWGMTPSCETGTAETEESNDVAHQHKCTITGLTPGTKYYYRITVDGQAGLLTGSFRAAPVPTEDYVQILAYGDTRKYSSGGSIAAHDSVCEKMLSRIEAEPDFQSLCIHSGDWCMSDDENSWTGEYFSRTNANATTFQSMLPVMGARGNHEDDCDMMDKYLPFPYGEAESRYYSFDYGPLHVTVLDLYSDWKDPSAQYTWLVGDLQAASAKEWRIIVLHRPGWSAGTHENDIEVQDVIQPLCLEYDVDIVLAGHNHNYARAEVDGVQHLVLGGGGASLYAVTQREYIVEKEDEHHHGEIKIDHTKLEFRAVTPGDAEIGSFTINHTPDTDPPSPNPATFSTAPYAVGPNGIAMTATEGSDPKGPVMYYFTETTGHYGASDSGWSTDRSYTDDGLAQSTEYTYTVKMRDAKLNVGTASSPASATTEVETASALVDLTAEDLPLGSLTTWTNDGTLGGNFTNDGTDPVVDDVVACRAVKFDGADHMISSFNAPSSLGGTNPFSIAVWAYNSSIETNEIMVSWSDKNADNPGTIEHGAFGYGSSGTDGAYYRYGADLGYDTVPVEDEWHHIVVTYSGGTGGEIKVYDNADVDNELTITDGMATMYGYPVSLGAMKWTTHSPAWVDPLTGWLATVQIYDYKLSDLQIQQLYDEGAPQPCPPTPTNTSTPTSTPTKTKTPTRTGTITTPTTSTPTTMTPTTMTPTPTYKQKGPYLIYPKDNTKMDVLWQLWAAYTCRLEWGLTTSYEIGNVLVLPFGDNQYKYTIPNLTPGTKYYYKVTILGLYVFKTSSFRAAPLEDAADVKILAYGDTHSYPPVNHSLVCGKMLDKIAADTNFQTLALHSGDWCSNNTETSWSTEYFSRNYSNSLQFQSMVPVMGACGDREYAAAMMNKYLLFPYKVPGDQYYSFDYGPVHIAVVDVSTFYTSGSAQYEWLEDDLAATTKEWKIILMHYSGWSAGPWANNTTVQEHIQPLCLTYNVDLLIAGHNHNYARANASDVIHITTGGGGAVLNNVNESRDNVVTATKAFHYCEIDVDGTTLTFTAVGSTIDNFTIMHPTPVPPQEP